MPKRAAQEERQSQARNLEQERVRDSTKIEQARITAPAECESSYKRGSSWKQDKNGDDRDEIGGRGTMQREAKTQGNWEEVEDSDEDKEDTEKPPWEQRDIET